MNYKTLDEDENVWWGPTFWKTYHIMALNFPSAASPIASQKMKEFVSAIPWTLPCEKCRVHCMKYIHENLTDSVVESNKNLFVFFVNFHNAVNIRLGKPQYSLEEALRLYSRRN